MDILCNNVSHTKTDSSDGESTVEVETSLFEELDEALNLCTLVYTMTAMRRQVRENKITQGTRSIMQLPISIKNANELVLAEKHHLTLSKYAENKRAMSSIVQTLSDRQQVKSSSRRSRSNPRRVSDGSNSFITTFGDESGHNSLVYAISVNHERKIVTLAFRGMETDVDWAPLNTKVFMKEMPNPMKLHSSQASTVRIHNKLHEMLIVPTYRDTNADTWTKISEYHDLLEEQVIPTLIENPGYKVSVCHASLIVLHKVGSFPGNCFTRSSFCWVGCSDRTFNDMQWLRVTHSRLSLVVSLLALRDWSFAGSVAGYTLCLFGCG